MCSKQKPQSPQTLYLTANSEENCWSHFVISYCCSVNWPHSSVLKPSLNTLNCDSFVPTRNKQWEIHFWVFSFHSVHGKKVAHFHTILFWSSQKGHHPKAEWGVWYEKAAQGQLCCCLSYIAWTGNWMYVHYGNPWAAGVSCHLPAGPGPACMYECFAILIERLLVYPPIFRCTQLVSVQHVFFPTIHDSHTFMDYNGARVHSSCIYKYNGCGGLTLFCRPQLIGWNFLNGHNFLWLWGVNTTTFINVPKIKWTIYVVFFQDR